MKPIYVNYDWPKRTETNQAIVCKLNQLRRLFFTNINNKSFRSSSLCIGQKFHDTLRKQNVHCFPFYLFSPLISHLPFFVFDGHLLSCIALSSVGMTFENIQLTSNDLYFEARLGGQRSKIFTGFFWTALHGVCVFP